jgi:hypothetical protein
MTRKDYELLANAINNEYRRVQTNDGKTVIQNVIAEIGEALEKDSERFDCYKFEQACMDRS